MLDPQVKEFYKDKIEKCAFYTPGVRLEVLRRGADAVFKDRHHVEDIAKWEDRLLSLTKVSIAQREKEYLKPEFAKYESFAAQIIEANVPDLKVRIFWPKTGGSPEAKRPVVLYFHGGGFVLHNIASHDDLTRKIANSWDAVVISAEYRLCPENSYPAYVQDAWALLVWVQSHADKLGIDPSKIILSGDSAGASISAAVSRLVAMLTPTALANSFDTATKPPIFEQVLFYGSYGSLSDDESESMRLFGGGDYVLPKTMLDEFTGYTLPPGGVDPDDPFFYPGRGTLPKDMPRSIVVSAECDPLRDDGRVYAKALKAASCDVTYMEAAGMMHGFLLYWHRFAGAEKIIKEISNIL